VGFVRDWQAKSLDDYLALFRRCVVVDFCLAVAYVVSATSTYIARDVTGIALGTMEFVLIGLLAALPFLWLLDAFLMCKLRSSAMAVADDKKDLSRLLVPACVCLTSLGIGLLVLLMHIGVDLVANGYASVVLGGAASVLLVVIVVQKGLWLLAVHSFGAWLRAHTEAEAGAEQHSTEDSVQVPTDAAAPAV